MRLKSLAVGIGVLVAVGIWQARADQEPVAKKEGHSNTADLLKHGEYLVNKASMCVDCHTPKDDQGQPDSSKNLRGSMIPLRPKEETKAWAEAAPDITGEGLAGKWSEEEMVKFLTTGNNPYGKQARPPMPAFRLNQSDARAIFLYLKSLPDE